jgi:CubicO group peptidase (beta-lactamase class C family)
MSALVGIAIAKGLIKDVDAPIFDYLPEYASLRTEANRGVTVRHLLTMTAGFKWDQSGTHNSETDLQNCEARMENSRDFARFILEQPITEPPGTKFNYNSGYTVLLAKIVQNAAKMPLDDFANENLWKPLGIEDHYWWRAPDKLPQAHAGLVILPRDMAKFGLLYLAGGKWGDMQVIPADWVKDSTTAHFGMAFYGYQWWLQDFPAKTSGGFCYGAEGNGGQYIFVFPRNWDFLRISGFGFLV